MIKIKERYIPIRFTDSYEFLYFPVNLYFKRNTRIYIKSRILSKWKYHKFK